MKKLDITIPAVSEKRYPIYVGENLLEKIGPLIDFSKYSQAVIVTDKNLEQSWLQKLQTNLPLKVTTIVLSPGEKGKNILSVQKIWSGLKSAHADRRSLLINLGGGVIGDTGGFAASTYMRGIDFLQIPTTTLASVDASVGGKTGIDFEDIKNLIGSFHQPIGVIIDVTTLQTLPEREFLNGFAEIIKHGLILDKKYFTFVTSKKPTEFTLEELVTIVTQSIEIKAKVVEHDEKESGLRKVLNFGHTIGHAIEAISLETKNPLMHGEAIHIGMIVETKISYMLGLLSKQEAKIIHEKLLQTGLPVKTNNIKTDDILAKVKLDKKIEKGNVNWTLLESIGNAVYDQRVDEAIVIKALKSVS